MKADELELQPNPLTGQAAIRTKPHKHNHKRSKELDELERTLPEDEKAELHELRKEKKELHAEFMKTKSVETKKHLDEVKGEIEEILKHHHQDLKAASFDGDTDDSSSFDDFSEADGEKTKHIINGRTILLGIGLGILGMWVAKKHNLL